ncbi:unnamed protein product [Sphagnum jensenii]|uniref:SET domain-containing protein n=1 Tax=Sphagnum jensenii TaxID=128206 RepID=A0ABP1BMH9_9BRYO
MERELESLGHFIEGIFHHPHHEHSAGHLVGPDHTETVHASEHFERSGLVAAHLAALHDAQMLELGLLPDSQLPDSEAPPAAPVLDEFPWKDLLPLSLADMKLGKTHRRHVLHGRLCVTAYKIHDVVSVLEEDCGLATVVMLKNAVPIMATMAQAQHCFPEGSRVAIRDPYLTRLPDGLVGVLVESPTDIVFLSRAVTAKDHCNFTSPSYQESNFVEKSSDEDVRQSPNSIQEASFPVSSDAPQQDDHHEEASVILDADHTNDQSSQQTGEEVEEETLPSVDLDGAAQSEQCHVDRDAVVGGLSGETEEFVSNLAVEDINNEVSASHNVVEGIAPGTCNVDREVVEDADTSKVAETKEVSSREVVEYSNEISFSNSTAQANESESCDIGTADADVEVAGYTATENNSIDDAVEFKEDGDREAVTRVSDVETTKTGEAKEVVSHPTMEECNDVLPSTIVDKVTKGDRWDVETEDTAAVSEVEADKIDEVKEVVSSPGTEDCEIFLPSENLNEAIDEESEDTVGVLEVETDKRDEAKEASSNAATEEWKENLPNTILDEDIDNDRCDGESDEVAGVSEVEGNRSNEEKEIVSSSTIEEFNESLPSTSVDATNEDDRCNKASEDVAEVSEVHMENSDELKELASNSTMEECNDILRSTTEDEATEDFSHDRESKDTTRALDMEGDKDNETKEIGSSPSTKECNDIVPSTNVDQGTLDNRHDEASDNVVGVLEVEVDKSDEVKEMSNSPTTEEVSKILSNTNADQAIEDERFDKESEDIVEISRLEANKTEHVNKIVSSPSIEECNDNVPNICGDEAIKDDMCVEENEGVARVPDVEATRGDEVKEVDSSVAMESKEIPPSIIVEEATGDEACQNSIEVSELEGVKSDEVKEVQSDGAMEESTKTPRNINVEEAIEDGACDTECKDKVDVLELEENKSNELKHVDNNVKIEETNEIPQTINAEEATKDVGDEECDDTSKALELEANKSDEMKNVDTSVAIGEFGEIPSNMNAKKATEDDVGDEECEETTIISKLEKERNAKEAIEDNVGDEECKDTTEVSEWEADQSDEMKDVERNTAIEESTEIPPNINVEETTKHDVHDEECKDAIQVSELEANKSDEVTEIERNTATEEFTEVPPSLNEEEAVEDSVVHEEYKVRTEVSELEGDNRDEVKEVESSASIKESNEIPQNINVGEAIEDNVVDGECKHTTEVSELETDNNDEMKEVEYNVGIKESSDIPQSLNVEEATKDNVADEECKDTIDVSKLEVDKIDEVKDIERGTSIQESSEIPQSLNVAEVMEDSVADEERKHTSELSELEANKSDEMKDAERSITIEESTTIHPSINAEETTENDVDEDCEGRTEDSELEADRSDEVEEVESSVGIKESNESLNVEKAIKDNVGDEESKDTTEVSELEADQIDEMKDAESSIAIEEFTEIHPTINAEETTEQDVAHEECKEATAISESEANQNDKVKEVESSVGIEEPNEIPQNPNVEEAVEGNVGDEESKDTTEVSELEADRTDEVEEVENSVGVKESNESLNVEKAIKDNVGDEESKDTTEVSELEADQSDEMKDAERSIAIEEFTEIHPTINAEETTEQDVAHEECKEATEISESEANQNDEVKEVESSVGIEEPNEIPQNPNVEEAVEGNVGDEESKDTTEVSELEADRTDEAEEVENSVGIKESNESLNVEKAIKDNVGDEEPKDTTEVSELEADQSDEMKDAERSIAIEEFTEIHPTINAEETTEQDVAHEECKEATEVSESESNKNDEVKEVESRVGIEEPHEIPQNPNVEEAVEGNVGDEESKDTTDVSELEADRKLEADQSDEMKDAERSIAMEEFTEIHPTINAEETTEQDVAHEECKEATEVSESEANQNDEVKEVESSVGIEEPNEIPQNPNVEEAVEGNVGDEESKDTADVSELEADRTDEVEEVENSVGMKESNESLNVEKAIKDSVGDEESKDTTEVSELEADQSDEMKDAERSIAIEEFTEIHPTINAEETTEQDVAHEECKEATEVSESESNKNDEVKEVESIVRIEEPHEIPQNPNVEEAVEGNVGDEESKDTTEVSELEADRTDQSYEMKDAERSIAIEEFTEIHPTINAEETTEQDVAREECKEATEVSESEANQNDEVKEVESSVGIEEPNEIPQNPNVEEAVEGNVGDEESKDTTDVSELEADQSDEMKDAERSIAIEEFTEIHPTINAEETTEQDVAHEECKEATEVSESEANQNDEVKEVESSVGIEEPNEIPQNPNVEEAVEGNVGDEESKDTADVSELEADRTDEVEEVENSVGIKESNESLNVEKAIKDSVGDEESKDTTEVSELEADQSDEMKDAGRSIAIEEFTEIHPTINAEETTEQDVAHEECKEATEVSESEANQNDEVKEVESSVGIEEPNEIPQNPNVEEAIEDNVGDEESKDTTEVSELEADRSDEMKDADRNIAIEECTEIPPNINAEETTEDDVTDKECKGATEVSELEANNNDEVKEVGSNVGIEESNEIPQSLTVEEVMEDSVDDEEREDTTEVSELEANKSDEVKNAERNIAIEESTEIPPNVKAEEIIDDDAGDEECKEAIQDSELEANKSNEMKEVENSAGIEESNEIPQSLNVEEAIEDNVGDEECKDTIKVSELEADQNRSEEMKNVERNIAIEESTEAQLPVDLSSTLEESLSANSLRLEGNKLFLQEDFYGATQLYTRGILQAMKEQEHSRSHGSAKKSTRIANGHGAESEVLLAYSNRAEAWIRLQEYEKGLEDAQKALALQPDHLKSLFRKGRALLGLHQYREAHSILQQAAPRAPSDKDLQAALHESTVRVQQSVSGLFDLSNFYLKGRYVGEFPSCADYIGPIKVVEVGHGRGRGLVLKKHVEAGELLLVSNPIAFMQLKGFNHHRGVEVSQESIHRKVQEAFAPIFTNPHISGSDSQKLHTLCDGETKLPVPPANWLTSNSRGRTVPMAPIDTSCISRIIQLNAFNGNATMSWRNLPSSADQQNQVENWGLWWLPSFINHSCMPNTSQILVGRALFIFASRDLQAGEEITRSYFDIFQPLQQRRDLSTKGWGFVCHCPRCKLEDALHTPLSQVTNHYAKLMEQTSRPKPERVSDAKHADNQATGALRFCHELERKLKDLKLRPLEENWLRASFVHSIDQITNEHELSPHLELVVEAMAAVCPGSESTLQMAVHAKDSAKHATGKKSVQFKSAHHRAMHICRCTYGKQKSSVLQSLVNREDR